MADPATVRDDPAHSRFVLAADGAVAVAAYARDRDVLTFTHTAVPPEAEGHGLATVLIAGALRLVRERGERIVPACAFVRAYLVRHPDERDLLA